MRVHTGWVRVYIGWDKKTFTHDEVQSMQHWSGWGRGRGVTHTSHISGKYL